MTGSAFDTYSDLLFKMVGILKVHNIYKLRIGNYIYLYKIAVSPVVPIISGVHWQIACIPLRP